MVTILKLNHHSFYKFVMLFQFLAVNKTFVYVPVFQYVNVFHHVRVSLETKHMFAIVNIVSP